MNAYLILLIANLGFSPKPDADIPGFAVYFPSLFLHQPPATKTLVLAHPCASPNHSQIFGRIDIHFFCSRFFLFLPIDLRPKKCTVWAGLINSHRTSSIYHKPNGPTSNATLRLSHRIPYGFSWWNRHRSPAVQVTGGLRRPRPGRQRAGRCRSVVASPGGLCSAGAMQPIPLGYPWDTLGIPLGQWLFWWLLLGLSAWEIPCHNKPQ